MRVNNTVVIYRVAVGVLEVKVFDNHIDFHSFKTSPEFDCGWIEVNNITIERFYESKFNNKLGAWEAQTMRITGGV